MHQIVVALKDIVVDADRPINLADLPQEEAIERIRSIYGQFAPGVDVSIEDGIATITLHETDTVRANQALDTYRRGVRAGERGKYEAAVNLFEQTLAILPNHVEAHRNLAMAHMELRNTKLAKRHLVRVMQLKPDDTWAHVIMGNLYLQQENDFGSAERYYEAAFDINPGDIYLLNSYGALKAKRGQFEEAKALFQQALAIDPNYANARYGLALCYERQGDLAATIAELQDLFTRPQSEDPRVLLAYNAARQVFLEANQQMAKDHSADMMARLTAEIDDYSRTGRYPIRLEQDNRILTTATSQIAWVHGREEHLIKYQPTQPMILPHLVAHEFEHIRMIDAAVRANRNRLFTSNEETKEYARRSVSNDIKRLQRPGIDAQTVNQALEQLIQGLSIQIFNTPLDMVIEYRIHQQRPYLYASQVASLHATQQEGIQSLDPAIQKQVPRRIWQANAAMNCAYALFTDFLFEGATNYAEAYRSSGQYHNGLQLFQLWQERKDDRDAGVEYDLVDAFARVLKLERWYNWRDDWASVRDVERKEAGAPDAMASALKYKERPAALYCLSALKTFEGMDHQHIFTIVSEIALLGQGGFDYRSSEQKYTLRTLPGSYSGLQLMCYMYVGFKIVQPSVDTGLDLEDAYQSALAMRQAGL